jgi:hypothetical protein
MNLCFDAGRDDFFSFAMTLGPVWSNQNCKTQVLGTGRPPTCAGRNFQFRAAASAAVFR